MTRRHHLMPFGAEVLPDGPVRFRLWAPGARQVDLALCGHAQEILLPMAPRSEGWFEAITDLAGCDTRYLFRIDGERRVPDPASRYQPEDVHRSSQVIDPSAFQWSDGDWRGRPWHEAVCYELHVGTFTQEGTFRSATGRLPYLAELGITAVQLMPIAEFPGRRNWGYDGVLKFTVESGYGTPEDFKDLVQTAHSLGLMVFLDVVYNHFGPEGNYLHLYAPGFFSHEHQTPWGDAINFDGEDSHWVRQFFIHNALFWLEEYHLDGLRLDAVHAIHDHSQPDILEEMADAVRRNIAGSRAVHLIIENDNNAAHYLGRDEHGCIRRYAAQWNDDIHHALHVLLTAEESGYYGDYADRPIAHLGRCLSEGFAFQGEPSSYRGGRNRGEPSRPLPPTAFVSFLQNHDQIGNRAFGERLAALASPAAVRAASAVLLLAPSPPLLFMGEEWNSRRPFLFFCDFETELARRVTEGRRQEFARFDQFRDPWSRERIPDPSALATYRQCVLDWEATETGAGLASLSWYRTLLWLRRREIVPRLAGLQGEAAEYRPIGDRGLLAHWTLGDGSRLILLANLGPEAIAEVPWPNARLLFAVPEGGAPIAPSSGLPPWSVGWLIQESANHER